jgi:hypothetical protein
MHDLGTLSVSSPDARPGRSICQNTLSEFLRRAQSRADQHGPPIPSKETPITTPYQAPRRTRSMNGATVTKRFLLPLVLIGALGLAGCSTPTVAEQVRSEKATETPAPTPSKPVFDANKAMEEYVNAVFAKDYETAGLLSSPGSVAERYLTHLTETQTAYVNAGQEYLLNEGEEPTVTFKDGVASVDYPESDFEYVWSNFEFDDRGLVTTWTTASGPMDGNIWTTPWEGAVGGNTVTLVSAYQSSGGALWVTLKVAAGASETNVNGYSATYVDASGGARSVAQSAQPSSLPPSSSGLISVVFDQADFGGTLHLDGYNTVDYTDWAVEIPVT